MKRMNFRLSCLFAVVLWSGSDVTAQCLTNFTTPAGQTTVGLATFTAVSVPPTTSVSMSVVTTLGLDTIEILGCNFALIANQAAMSGPHVPAGTTITGGTCQATAISAPATATDTATYVFTMPAYALPYPPTNHGVPPALNCSVCPAFFTAPICAGQYFTYYMCASNAYSISMCSATANWDSYLSITDATGTTPAPGTMTTDDDGCGVVDGHASLTYIPTISGVYRVRLWLEPCSVSAANCGTVTIACNPTPIGIEETEPNNLSLSIQPNPAHDRITVNLPTLSDLDWRICDTRGRTALTGRSSRTDRTTIGILDLAAGTYLLHAMDHNGRMGTATFVKD